MARLPRLVFPGIPYHVMQRAAERLGMSQPALSAQLARLRDLFDDPLLIQSGRRMVPTPRAEALAQTLHRLVGDMARSFGKPRFSTRRWPIEHAGSQQLIICTQQCLAQR
jgi:DNA-binding transcriptional LysR family regulator